MGGIELAYCGSGYVRVASLCEQGNELCVPYNVVNFCFNLLNISEKVSFAIQPDAFDIKRRFSWNSLNF
jgi:hypothetical protein